MLGWLQGGPSFPLKAAQLPPAAGPGMAAPTNLDHSLTKQAASFAHAFMICQLPLEG